MIEQGKIIKSLNNTAEVEIIETVGCAGCNNCHTFSPGRRTVSAVNSIDARAGDCVRVSIRINTVFSAAILYMTPLAFFFIFFIFSSKIGVQAEPLSALFGFTGMFLCYGLIRLFGRRRPRNYIIEKIPSKGDY